jgi:hypothetical protein
VVFLDFLKRGPRKKQCSRGGQQAAHGYSQSAEPEANQIEPLCVARLTQQLHRDYSNFSGHAIVVAPAAGLPCYVFREQRIPPSMLSRIGTCQDCQSQGRSLWIQSHGLTIENFDDVLKKSPEQTLLTWGNPAAVSLCGTCSATADMEFFEICSPHNAQEGFVLPMAY